MQVDVGKIVNKGLYRIAAAPEGRGEAACSGEGKTVIILSPPRSCSSLVAGVLSHLGVFMGETADKVVFEDTQLAKLLEGGKNWPAVERLIRQYNEKYRVWGYKRPSAIDYLENWFLAPLANPHLIFIFRDPLAVSLRTNRSSKANDLGKQEVLATMEDVLKKQDRMIQLIKRCTVPALLISSEKIRHYKAELVAELVSFLGLECTSSMVQRAIEFIELEPEKYLNEARADRTVGRIEELNERGVSGWVRLVAVEKPCTVIVLVNSTVRAVCTADLPREELGGAHSTGRCGFKVTLADEESISPDDYIEVVTEEDSASVLFAGKVGDWRKNGQ